MASDLQKDSPRVPGERALLHADASRALNVNRNVHCGGPYARSTSQFWQVPAASSDSSEDALAIHM